MKLIWYTHFHTVTHMSVQIYTLQYRVWPLGHTQRIEIQPPGDQFFSQKNVARHIRTLFSIDCNARACGDRDSVPTVWVICQVVDPTRIEKREHTHTHAHTQKNTLTHTHKHTHSHTQTHTHIHMYTNTHSHTHTNTHSHTHTHTHRHTHTQTLARPKSPQLTFKILTYLLYVNTNQTVHNLPLEYLPTSYTLIPTSSLMGVKIFQKVTPWLVRIDSKWPETCSLILSAWSILASTFSSHSFPMGRTCCSITQEPKVVETGVRPNLGALNAPVLDPCLYDLPLLRYSHLKKRNWRISGLEARICSWVVLLERPFLN